MRYPSFRTIVAVVALLAASGAGAVSIDSENFDGLADWTSDEALSPPGFYEHRNQQTWAPSTGFPANREGAEILASNASLARGGVGKSYVHWRESFDGPDQFYGDAVLARYYPAGFTEVYVSFYIRFSPTWTNAGQSKLFRIYSWKGPGNDIFRFFPGGNAGPAFLWDYAHNDFGVRNLHAYRGGPHGESYNFPNGSIQGLPRALVSTGDLPLNFTSDTVNRGAFCQTPQIPDQVNGGFISDNLGQTVLHEQVFGDGTGWTKVGFYFRMNSAISKPDGVLLQWIDDQLVFQSYDVPWIRESTANLFTDIKWNVIALGGNDLFRSFPNDDRYEEYYAIDDLEVHDSIPVDLRAGFKAAPGSFAAEAD